MGLILDSSVLIAVERKGRNARGALAEIAAQISGEDVAVSVITLMELAHGASRANTSERRTLRLRFIDELARAVPVHPVSLAVALQSGRIDGENASRGLRLALSDLLIGVTALELGYAVATGNVSHFEMVPGLRIVSL